MVLPPPLSGVIAAGLDLGEVGIVFGPTLSGTTGASLAIRFVLTSLRFLLYSSL